MSQEAVPEPSAPDPGNPAAVPAQSGGTPKGLLEQMEEMMAALNADLSRLDADLQSSGERPPAAGAGEGNGPF